MRNYLKLLSFLKDHKRVFGLAIVYMFLASLFEGVQFSLIVPLTDRIFTKRQIIVPNKLPPFLTHLVDQLNQVDPLTLLWIMPIILLVLLIVKHIVMYLYQYYMSDVSQLVMRDVRMQLYDKLQNLSLDYFTQKRTGELLSRITNDVGLIENAVSYGVTDLFRQTFLIAVYITIAFSIHARAAVIIFFVFPFMAWPLSVLGKTLRKIAKSTQERMADMSSILIETISGVKVVKAFCTEAYELERFRVKNQDFYKLKMKSTRRTLWIAPITEIVGAICGIMIFCWLGKQVISEKLSFGIFALFFGSIMQIISPIKKLGNVNVMTQQALAANERIYEVLSHMPTVKERSDGVNIPPICRNIILDNVTFRYDETNSEVLKNINLQINVGELVAIVGPTGTGKTTLVNLIPRFYDATSGKVKIDDVDVREVTFKSLRSQIGIVAQETFLFNDTVRANIAYGTPNVSLAEIESAAKKAYAHQFVTSMPHGYDTIIGDRGFRLSGGEKQRIAIARAILKNPPILILDEATSQLDSESEKYVQDALDDLMRGRTVIAIAHRLSTIIKADKIVVLDKGRVVGQGKHDALLQTCDLYKRLYETQFQHEK